MGTSITISDEYAEKLEEIADKHERSMAGQVRVWVKTHKEADGL